MAPDVAFASLADKNEFTKYSKFLAYKAVQVIVESRKGVKIEPNTKKSQTSDSEWFNLQIPDNPDVNKATKNVLPSDRVLETFEIGLHVEISVKTEDGDEMVLEIWTLGLDDNQCDPSLTTLSTVYSRMSILLKSLISITRITPAYQLSRRQRTESFTIFYRVYTGDTKNKILGDSIKNLQVGMLKTPRGGIFFSVAYRTDMSITPNKTVKNTDLLLKSDHFEMSPKRIVTDPNKKEIIEKPREIDINKPLRLAAFVDEMLIKKVFEEFLRKYPLPKCSMQFKKKPDECTDVKEISETDSAAESKPPIMEEPIKKVSSLRSESDAPLNLLYFPFADRHPIRELAEFYKEFFNAPHLRLSNEFEESAVASPDLEEDYKDEEDNLSKDLELYESSVQEFDELLAEMCRSTEWTGS